MLLRVLVECAYLGGMICLVGGLFSVNPGLGVGGVLVTLAYVADNKDRERRQGVALYHREAQRELLDEMEFLKSEIEDIKKGVWGIEEKVQKFREEL